MGHLKFQKLVVTCDQQGSRAVGLPSVVLSKAGVSAIICSGHVENLQASVLPDQHPEERQPWIPSRAARKRAAAALKYSARCEGQKSSECCSACMKKSEESAPNDLPKKKLYDLENFLPCSGIKLSYRQQCLIHFHPSYSIFMHEKCCRSSSPHGRRGAGLVLMALKRHTPDSNFCPPTPIAIPPNPHPMYIWLWCMGVCGMGEGGGSKPDRLGLFCQWDASGQDFTLPV